MPSFTVKCTSNGAVTIHSPRGDKTLQPGESFDLCELYSSYEWMCYDTELQSLINDGYLLITGNTFIAAPRSGIFAYFSTTADIVTTLADTWYPLAGPWVNSVVQDFGVAADGLSIAYTGNTIQHFEIQINSTWSTDTPATTIHMGMYYNGVLLPSSVHVAKIAQVGQYRHLSNTSVVQLSPDDTIQVVVRSDKAGATITAQNLSTSAQKFF
jgi:hypothetical protein